MPRTDFDRYPDDYDDDAHMHVAGTVRWDTINEKNDYLEKEPRPMTEQSTLDYGFMNVELDDFVEQANAPVGEDCQLTIEDAKPDAEKYGVMVRLGLINPTEPTNSIFHWVSFPKPDDTAESRNFKLGFAKQFCECFEIEGPERSDPNTWHGKSGFTILKTDTYEGRVSSKIDKMLTRR